MATRKVVTVVFCDVVDSTARGEQLDPERMRATMGRYFTVAREILEAHGGTVEKYIGDAVMAVFGVPTLHEDDAVRALRAAGELAVAVRELEFELPSGARVPLEVRIGVNSGEVLAGDDGEEGVLTTGDPVNTAARLQQAADPGEVLVGERTRRLARGLATFEPVKPVAAKGKSSPVKASRLIDVATEDGREPAATRLVGRAAELRRLRALFDEIDESHTPELVTVVGAAGIGKSRLVAEFLTGLEGRAQVLRGRCLPYGSGVTYFPLTQLVRAAAGITDRDDRAAAHAKLDGIVHAGPEAVDIRAAIASAIGLEPAPVHEEEIFWATRRLLEGLAGGRPQVVVLEDIHWAEPAFLDLLEYLADFISGSALLLLCVARPDVFERRPGWGRSRDHASTIELDSLGDAATLELLEQLDGSEALTAELRERIFEAAEGNPLYVEEMMAMLVEDGHVVRDGVTWRSVGQAADIQVPPNIGALLAARIDGLPEREREVAERASVIGRVFEASAVRELVRGEASADVGRNLLSLVRKELIRPNRAELSLGDAYKFRHILIRDAAYRALPKAERATLHQAFADWLERAAGDRIDEYAEILGYHLEQAHGYLIELGVRDRSSPTVATRAATWLARASDRAAERRDVPAWIALAERAIALTPESDATYPRLLISLAEGLSKAGSHRRATELLDRVLAWPNAASGDRALAGVARVFVLDDVELVGLDEMRCAMAAAIPVLLSAGDKRKVVELFGSLGNAYMNAAQTQLAERYMRKSARLCGRWGIAELEAESLMSLAGLGARSTMPVSDGVALCKQALALGLRRGWVSYAHETLAYLEAMRGRFDLAHSYLDQAETEAREMGMLAYISQMALDRGVVARLERRFDDAVAAFRMAYHEHAEEHGAFGGPRPFHGARLAQACVDAGRVGEARSVLEEVRGTFSEFDGWTRTVFQGTDARLAAAEGRADEGLRLAQQMVERARTDHTDQLVILFANALEDLAACADAAGHSEVAAAARAEAFAMYDAKGVTVEADRLRPVVVRPGR